MRANWVKPAIEEANTYIGDLRNQLKATNERIRSLEQQHTIDLARIENLRSALDVEKQARRITNKLLVLSRKHLKRCLRRRGPHWVWKRRR